MEGGTERLEGLSGFNLHAYMPDAAFPQTGTSHQDPLLLPAKLNCLLCPISVWFVLLISCVVETDHPDQCSTAQPTGTSPHTESTTASHLPQTKLTVHNAQL